MTDDELRQLRDKWRGYAARMQQGNDVEGSIFGASFLIATSALPDIALLFAEIDRLKEIERCAKGLVSIRPDAPRQGWWYQLEDALSHPGEKVTP